MKTSLSKYLRSALLGAVLTFGGQTSNAAAQNVSVSSDFRATVSNVNAGGGISHIPDGDLLVFTSDFITGPTITRVDANNDGFPAGGSKVLKQFPSTAFGSFVQVAPNGAYALAGVGGSQESILKIDLGNDSVTTLFDLPGVYDVAFLDDTSFYLSANPGGFNASIPNRISLIKLTTPPTLETVAEFNSTPSGPITLDTSGNLYYIKGTFAFPAPPQSFHLMRFPATGLAAAAANRVPLTEVNSEIDVPLNGGYDLVYHQNPGENGELYLSVVNNEVYRVPTGTLIPQLYLSVDSPSFPAISAMSFLEPTGRFNTDGASRSELAMSLSVDFFSTYKLIQVRSTTFDTDGDGFADTADFCPTDSAKVTIGICGCGQPELDSNNDALVDCGNPRSFSQGLVPDFGIVTGGSKSVTVVLEKLVDPSLSYKVELSGPSGRSKRKSKNTSSNVVTFTKLKAGVYEVKYSVSQKLKGKRRVTSQKSGTILVGVS